VIVIVVVCVLVALLVAGGVYLRRVRGDGGVRARRASEMGAKIAITMHDTSASGTRPSVAQKEDLPAITPAIAAQTNLDSADSPQLREYV